MSHNKPTCYLCGALATTKEHTPPKSFFPKGGSLQLKTVPSCIKHNNDKSGDDQYLLAHISMNAGFNDNLASKIFFRSIEPQLDRSDKFLRSIINGVEPLSSGGMKYQVDIMRFDNFFDHLAFAVYFDRYKTPMDNKLYKISHSYLSLITQDQQELQNRKFLTSMLGNFFTNFKDQISSYEADRIDEIVYQNKIIDPGGNKASITIAHTFYGVFEVVTLLSRNWA